ncbi:hypothetical protein BTS2_1757 [Bacillus sp. TS-2]|nr:hypothetical protein BTS2_1757 [Bacillus sp. TS-2]
MTKVGKRLKSKQWFRKALIYLLVCILVLGPNVTALAELDYDSILMDSEASDHNLLLQLLEEEYGTEQVPEMLNAIQHLGLVDQNGEFLTHPIHINNEIYTLEELEDLLENEQIDLNQDAEVDGEFIPLESLKKIIEIENQLDELDWIDQVELTVDHLDQMESLFTQVSEEGLIFRDEEGNPLGEENDENLSLLANSQQLEEDIEVDYEDQATVTITDYSNLTGNQVSFQIELSEPQENPVSFSYELIEGTLKAFNEPRPTNNIVTFEPGEVEKELIIRGVVSPYRKDISSFSTSNSFDLTYPMNEERSKEFRDGIWMGYARADYIHFYNFKNIDSFEFDIPMEAGKPTPFTHSYSSGAYISYAAHRGSSGNLRYCDQEYIRDWDNPQNSYTYVSRCTIGDILRHYDRSMEIEIEAKEGRYITGQILPYKVTFDEFVIHNKTPHLDPVAHRARYPFEPDWYLDHTPKMELMNGEIAIPAMVTTSSYESINSNFRVAEGIERTIQVPGAMGMIRGYQTVIPKGATAEDLKVLNLSGEGKNNSYDLTRSLANRQQEEWQLRTPTVWDQDFTNNPEIIIDSAQVDAFGSFSLDKENYVVGDKIRLLLEIDNEGNRADWIIDGNPTPEQLSERLKVSIGNQTQGIISMDWKLAENGLPKENPYTLEGTYEITEDIFDLMTEKNQETGKLRAKVYYNRDYDPNRDFENDGEITDNFAIAQDFTQNFTVKKPVYILPEDLKIVYPSVWPSDEENKVLLTSAQPTKLEFTYPENASYITPDQFEWKSNDPNIASILDDGTIVPRNTGMVTFTLVAKNGGHLETEVTTIEIEIDGSGAATVIVPDFANYVYVHQGKAANMIWSTNVMSRYQQLAEEGEEPERANFTVKLFKGNVQEDKLEDESPIQTWQGPETEELINASNFQIPGDYIEEISEGAIPSYTVQISTEDPEIPTRTLSTVAYIMVLSESAIVSLDKSSGQFILDDVEYLDLEWDLKNFDMRNQGDFEFSVSKNGTLIEESIIRFDADNNQFTADQVDESGGRYRLAIDEVKESNRIKDEYAVSLAVKNGLEATWSYDSLYLQVYRNDGLDIIIDGDAKNSHVMDNNPSISEMTSEEILALNRDITLTNDMSINYQEYRDLGALVDQIEWNSTEQDIGIINFNSHGNLADIEKRPYASYQPHQHFLLTGIEDGETKIRAKHSRTGMETELDVTVNTLKDKLYLFQFYPKAMTTITYTDKSGEEKEVDSNASGELALYDENGIDSDVYVTSQFNDTTYTGVISQEMLLTQEKNPASLEVYPTNILQLRQLANVEVFFKEPNGRPYTGEVTYRGAVYKNGNYAKPTEISGKGITERLSEDGKLTVIFDTTDFYSPDAGEANAATLSAADDIEFIIEVMFEDNLYYPQVIMTDGNTNPIDMVLFDQKTSRLKENPTGEASLFMSNQYVTNPVNSLKQQILELNGKFGPNNQFPTITLTTEFMWWGDEQPEEAYVELLNDEGVNPPGQASETMQYPFSNLKMTTHQQILNKETIWLEKTKSGSFQHRVYHNLDEFKQSFTSKASLVNMIGVEEVNVRELLGELDHLRREMNRANGGVNPTRNSDKVIGESLRYLSNLKLDAGPLQMKVIPTNEPNVFKMMMATSFGNIPTTVGGTTVGSSGSVQFMKNNEANFYPGVGDVKKMIESTYLPGMKNALNANRSKPSYSSKQILFSAGGYYVGEIRYNTQTSKWETIVEGGGFTAGGGFEYTHNWNIKAGPVPLTFSLTVGGGAEVDFKASVLYDEISDLPWSNSDVLSVNDYKTSLRVIAYVEAFGGIGFDFSVIAAKIGLYGRVTIENTSTWLNRDYLANGDDRVWYGNKLTLEGVVGVRVVLKFLFIKFSHDFASLRYSYTWLHNNWTKIEEYWKEHAHMPLTEENVDMAISAYMEHIGVDDLHVFESNTIEDRDYLETHNRIWYGPSARFMQSFSTYLREGPNFIQENAYPHSDPKVTQDGSMMVYLSDAGSTDVEDTVASWAIQDPAGSNYIDQGAIAPDWKGYGDSELQVAGEGNLIAATWVTQNGSLEKEAGEDVENEDILLMMNSTEIMVSIYDGQGWETHQITDNRFPDLAPVVTVSDDKVFVAYRSVYATNSNNPLDFSEFDSIVYTIYDTNTGEWSDVETLYNGTNGSIMGLTAESLQDGTAAVVYTVDQGDAYQDPVDEELVGNNQEIIYSILDMDRDEDANATTWKAKGMKKNLQVTEGKEVNVNPQLTRASFNGQEQFVLAWHATSLKNDMPYHRIKLMAIDRNGEIDSTFIDSLEGLNTHEEVKISPNFTFARMPDAHNDITSLSFLWKEANTEIANDQIRTWDTLKAVKIGKNEEDWYLSGIMDVVKMPDFTEIDQIAAFVANPTGMELKTVLLGTEYTTDAQEIGTITLMEGEDLPVLVSEEISHMYTTNGIYENEFGIEGIGFNPLEIVSGFDLPIQFEVLNQGVHALDSIEIEIGGQTMSYQDVALLPNSSNAFTVPYEVPTPIQDVTYEVRGVFTNGQTFSTGETIAFDVPDLGVSPVQLLAEEDGKRLLSIPLYNKNGTTLKNKGRNVKVGLYTSNLQIEDEQIGNTYTISDELDLDLIDEGAFTLNVEVDIKDYLDKQNLTEIPDEGIDIFVHSWIEDAQGEMVSELDEANNQAKILIDPLALKYNQDDILITLEQKNEGGTTSVDITMQNMKMSNLQNGNVLLQLFDKEGKVLESQYMVNTASQLLTFSAEEKQKQIRSFSQEGETVTATFFQESPDTLDASLSEVTITGVSVGFEPNKSSYNLQTEDLRQTEIVAIASHREAIVSLMDKNGEVIVSNQGYIIANQELLSSTSGEENLFSITVNPESSSAEKKDYQFTILNKTTEKPLLEITTKGQQGEDGRYNGDVELVLSAYQIDGFEIEKALYQLDDGDWVEIAYDGKKETILTTVTDEEILEDISHRVRAQVVLKSGKKSNLTPLTITIAGYPMAPKIEATTEWTNEESVPVMIHSEDENDTLQYQFNDINEERWLPYPEGLTVTAEGETTIYARAVNQAGNVSEIVSTIVRINRTASSAPIIEVSSEWTNETSVPFVIIGEEFNRIQYQLNETEETGWVHYSEGAEVIEEGETTIYARTIDRAGNISEINSATVRIDRTPPMLTLLGENPLSIHHGEEFLEPGYEAIDDVTQDLEVIVEGQIDTSLIGQQELQYRVQDEAGNETVKTRIVYVIDVEQPIITLNGENPLILEVGTIYEEPGATAIDLADGDLTDQIVIDTNVDTSKLGSYEVKYMVTDLSGNHAEAIRTIEVIDTTAPEIELIGEDVVRVEWGDSYQELGASAKDNYDGDLTDNIEVIGTVNTEEIGVYQITYRVVDRSGNLASITRKVYVEDTNPPTDVKIEATTVTNRYVDLYFTANDQSGVKEFILFRDEEEIARLDGGQEVYRDVNVIEGNTYYYEVMAIDSFENASTTEGVEIGIPDYTAPVITLIGDEVIYHPVGTPYEDFGATAEDAVDGELTSHINVSFNVNTNQLGSYQIVYQVEDSSGNQAELIRMVQVVDWIAPELELKGGAEERVELGQDYEEKGARANDNYDGDITDKIKVVGLVNTEEVGVYTITYSVMDQSGNRASLTRSVHVVDTTAPTDVELEVKEVTHNRVKLTFSAQDYAGIQSYVLSRDGKEIAHLDGDINMFDDKELQPGTLYEYVLSAIDPSGNASKSDTVKVTTKNQQRRDLILELDGPLQVIEAGTTVKIKGTRTSLQMPNDLPAGTKLQVLTVTDLKHKGLEIAGEYFDFHFVYPEGEEEYGGNFILTMGIDQLDENPSIYHYNEVEQNWIMKEGKIHSDTITAKVSHFSIYGVFVTKEQPEEEHKEEKTKSIEEERIEKEDDHLGPHQDKDDNKENLPSTATSIYNLLFAGVMILVIGAAMFYYQRKKYKQINKK